jgi:2-oxoglutarate ferredoxin oxidoreductase subunit alpha
MVLLDSDLQSDADTLVLSFGITARTTRQAVQLARQRRKRVSTINVLSLFPVPEAPLVEAAARVSRVVVAEENLSGQYRSVLAQLLWNKELVGVNKIGAMITPAEIEAQIL